MSDLGTLPQTPRLGILGVRRILAPLFHLRAPMPPTLRTWQTHPAFGRGTRGLVDDLSEGFPEAGGETAWACWRGLMQGRHWATLLEEFQRLSPDHRERVAKGALFAHAKHADRALRQALTDRTGAAREVVEQHASAFLAVAPSDYVVHHPVRRLIHAHEAGVLGAFLRAGASPAVCIKSAPGAPLHHAVREGWLEGVRLLVAHGASFEQPDGQGHPALHVAARQAKLTAIRELAVLGADLDQRDQRFHTPLSVALTDGTQALGKNDGDSRLEVVRTLLELGARTDLHDGKTARSRTVFRLMGDRRGPGFVARAQEALLQRAVGQPAGSTAPPRSRL